MIGNLKVYVWALAVSCAFLGYGVAFLRILRTEQHRWLIGASTGCAVVVTMLGLMNLMGWIRPLQISIMIAVGDVFFLFLLPLLLPHRKQKTSKTVEDAATATRSMILNIMTWFVLVLAVGIATSGINSHIVNRYDDLQAYLAYPENTLQNGSLQPQPFSERRISTSLGANYLLDAVMAVDGDVRSISFIDLCFGYLLYAAAIWAIGTTLKLSFEANGALLLLLIILPPIQNNDTIVYLSSALMVVLLLTMHTAADRPGVNWKSGVLCGLLASVLCLTKSNNIVFTLPLILVYALCSAARSRKLAQIWNAAISLATLAILTLPWMVQQFRNEGTFFYPSLGRGFHASHWGLLPLPGQTLGTPGILLSAFPFVFVLLLAVLLALRLTSRSNSFDTALISFLGATVLATPLVAFAIGGEALDKYSAPFHIPALLLFAALMFRTFKSDMPKDKWLWAGRIYLFAWVSFMLVDYYHFNRMYRPYADRITYVDERRMGNPANFELLLTNSSMQGEAARARNAQNAVPVGEKVLGNPCAGA